MPPIPQNIQGLSLQIPTVPLTQSSFAPFGAVIANPRPDIHPSTFSPTSSDEIPHNPIPANQGTAIKYQHVSPLTNLYPQAPSQQTGKAVMNLFSCASRPLSGGEFEVRILERHPFTTQTFIPLVSTQARYLVIVAPSLSPSDADEGLPVPDGRGLPDVKGLKAFVATAGQAVTYGAGTWHAPMVALEGEGDRLDFVVVQFANGVGGEDCQEVVFEGGRVVVRVGERARL